MIKRLLESQTLTLQRRNTAGDYSDVTGKWEDSVPTPIEIKCNIQPFKASQTLMLPEADRTKEWLNVWSTSPIQKANEGVGGNDADTFAYEGNTYKVMAVSAWKVGVLNHYHAKASMVGKTPLGEYDGE